MQFALHVAKHVRLLKSTCSGQPQLPELLPAATSTFQSMRYGVEAELWSFVKFEDVFVYRSVEGADPESFPGSRVSHIQRLL